MGLFRHSVMSSWQPHTPHLHKHTALPAAQEKDLLYLLEPDGAQESVMVCAC